MRKRDKKKDKYASKPKKQQANSQKMNMLDVAESILKLLRENPATAFSGQQICKTLQIQKPNEKEAIQTFLENLVKQGLIQQGREGTFQGIEDAEMLVGKVEMATRDYGFVVVEGYENDVRVSARHLNSALDGDIVKILVHKFKNEKPEGEIVEVLERSRTEFVGKIEVSVRYAFVIPDYKKMFSDIFIPFSAIGHAQQGDKVVADITNWSGKNPTGRVKKILGRAGDNDTEMHAIMAEYSLPYEYPREMEFEAEKIETTISNEEIKKRRDFRNILTFTIDPHDAKDFDDAISFQVLENGNYEIGIHIADVTHYVLPDSILEQEARRRATSVYLVDRVVPMLPEKLSNFVCSLRPNEDKLTFSAVFEITERAKVVDSWFGRTIIHSNRRFSYEEAQEVLENKNGDCAEELLKLNHIAKQLQKKRIAQGAVLFESVEVKFKLDEKGKPLEIIPKVRKDAHKLIEEFMLLANRSVAEFVFKQRKGKDRNSMVYRTHDEPDAEKLANFANFVKQFGYSLEIEPDKISKSLNQMSLDSEGKPEQNVLQQIAVRTMAKAKYTTKADGHFGLAFEHYSHFTSPIRRYPDMMAHRLIAHYLADGKSMPAAELELLCKHSSDMEKRAADAERASIKYKQVELMTGLLNKREKMAGIITGVTEWGIYVEVSQTRCEGMLRLADMQDDYYELDEKNYAIVGRRYKKSYRLGDEVLVYLKSTDLEKRQIDYYMAT